MKNFEFDGYHLVFAKREDSTEKDPKYDYFVAKKFYSGWCSDGGFDLEDVIVVKDLSLPPKRHIKEMICFLMLFFLI
jgi:hypothetical protein